MDDSPGSEEDPRVAGSFGQGDDSKAKGFPAWVSDDGRTSSDRIVPPIDPRRKSDAKKKPDPRVSNKTTGIRQSVTSATRPTYGLMIPNPSLTNLRCDLGLRREADIEISFHLVGFRIGRPVMERRSRGGSPQAPWLSALRFLEVWLCRSGYFFLIDYPKSFFFAIKKLLPSISPGGTFGFSKNRGRGESFPGDSRRHGASFR